MCRYAADVCWVLDMRANLANITAVEITQKLQKQQRLFENGAVHFRRI